MFKKIMNKKVTLKKYRPAFTTIDNVKHEGANYKYVIDERIICSIPKYLMTLIKSDGYIEDIDNIMYPIHNVLSIEWKLIDEFETKDVFSEFETLVSDKEVRELKGE